MIWNGFLYHINKYNKLYETLKLIFGVFTYNLPLVIFLGKQYSIH